MIRHASIEEKRKTYEWLCLSDTTSSHMGAPHFPENPILSWEEFQQEFEDFYYREDDRQTGSILIIENGDEEIGCVCYACFHLREQAAELDIWLKDESYCGKGIGTQALKETINYLHKELNINSFLIRPSERNIRAIKAYQKAGFTYCITNKEKILSEYLKSEYAEYKEGDYGLENTALLILKINT